MEKDMGNSQLQEDKLHLVATRCQKSQEGSRGR